MNNTILVKTIFPIGDITKFTNAFDYDKVVHPTNDVVVLPYIIFLQFF